MEPSYLVVCLRKLATSYEQGAMTKRNFKMFDFFLLHDLIINNTLIKSVLKSINAYKIFLLGLYFK